MSTTGYPLKAAHDPLRTFFDTYQQTAFRSHAGLVLIGFDLFLAKHSLACGTQTANNSINNETHMLVNRIVLQSFESYSMTAVFFDPGN